MNTLGPPLVAFAVGFAFTLVELVTSKYSRTFFAVKRLRAFYVYGAIYGLIALFVTLAYSVLAEGGAIKLEGIGIGNSWTRAVLLGLSTKALMHIRLISVNTFPVGIETLVMVFEPWLLGTIIREEFNGVRAVIDPRAQKYPDLVDDKTRILNYLATGLPADELKTFKRDLDATTTVEDAMELYLRFMGKHSFDHVFPP